MRRELELSTLTISLFQLASARYVVNRSEEYIAKMLCCQTYNACNLSSTCCVCICHRRVARSLVLDLGDTMFVVVEYLGRFQATAVKKRSNHDLS